MISTINFRVITETGKRDALDPRQLPKESGRNLVGIWYNQSLYESYTRVIQELYKRYTKVIETADGRRQKIFSRLTFHDHRLSLPATDYRFQIPGTRPFTIDDSRFTYICLP